LHAKRPIFLKVRIEFRPPNILLLNSSHLSRLSMPFSVSSDEGQKTPKTSQVTEKFSRAKIRLSDSGDSQIGLFHALEARSRNHGKRGHWTDLDAAYGGLACGGRATRPKLSPCSIRLLLFFGVLMKLSTQFSGEQDVRQYFPPHRAIITQFKVSLACRQPTNIETWTIKR
jgi:hypothetical protein